MHDFSVRLVPFQVDSQQSWELNACALRQNSKIILEYQCTGKLEELLVPTSQAAPNRLDHLWEHTCFEAFISWDGYPGYWELNFSPTGDWNFYHFDSYRTGQTQENRITQVDLENLTPVFDLTTQSKIHYRMSINLSPILPTQVPELTLGLTAVLEKKDNSKSYWALTHCDEKPNFHRRESFKLRLK